MAASHLQAASKSPPSASKLQVGQAKRQNKKPVANAALEAVEANDRK